MKSVKIIRFLVCLLSSILYTHARTHAHTHMHARTHARARARAHTHTHISSIVLSNFVALPFYFILRLRSQIN